MESLIKEFLEILLYQKSVHEELLALARDKKDVLINNNIDALKEIAEKERLLVKKLKELESKREVSAEEIAKSLNLSEGEVSFDTLREHAGDRQKKAVDLIREGLKSVISELALANSINADLIKTHLDYTYFSIDMMTQTGVSADTYDSAGYMKENSKSRIGLIDQKA